jgi:hypothetical protein
MKRRERGSTPPVALPRRVGVRNGAVIWCLLLTATVYGAPMIEGRSSVLVAARIRIVDRTREAGLFHKRTGTWGSLWVDRDRDGWPELFVGRHGAQPFFFRNHGGSYRRVRYDFVSPRGYASLDGDDWVDRHNCAWGEATGDGQLDLYCAVGANEGTGVGPNQLIKFGQDGIRDVAKRYGLRDSYGRGRSVNWLDFDLDGDLDLYLGNWARANHSSGLFRNRRGEFRRVSVGVSDQLRTISSSWSDWDRDGDPDLLVMQYASPTIAYLNTGARFRRVSLPGITDGNWYSAAWGDYNGDGRTDVHLVGESRESVFKNVRGSFRRVHTSTVTEGRTSTWFDLENDGDLDLYVVRGAPGISPTDSAVNKADFLLVRSSKGFVRVQRRRLRGRLHGSGDTVTASDHDRDGRVDLFVTNGYFEYQQWRGRSSLFANRTRGGGWVGVDLRGGRWNPLGYGSRIKVIGPHFSYAREITDGVTFRGQSEVGHVHLGIRGARRVRVRIRWPTGERDCISLTRGATAALRRGSQPCG